MDTSEAERKQIALAYTLREAEKAIRHMMDTGQMVHAFDVGKLADGTDLSLFMVVLPTALGNALMTQITGEQFVEVDL